MLIVRYEGLSAYVTEDGEPYINQKMRLRVMGSISAVRDVETDEAGFINLRDYFSIPFLETARMISLVPAYYVSDTTKIYKTCINKITEI